MHKTLNNISREWARAMKTFHFFEGAVGHLCSSKAEGGACVMAQWPVQV